MACFIKNRILAFFLATVLLIPMFVISGLCEASDDQSHLIVVTDGNNKYTYEALNEVEITHGGKIAFPEIMEKDGFLFAGWYSDGEYKTPVKNGKTVAKSKIFARWIELDKNDLLMEGVKLRVKGAAGLAFVSKLTHKTRADLIALSSENAVLSPENSDFNATTDISYGTVVFPKQFVPSSGLEKDAICTLEEKTYKAKTVPAKNTFEVGEGFDRYNAVIVGIDQKDFLYSYSARPYITYTDASGVKRTAYGAEYSANVYDTALKIYQNGAALEPGEKRQDIMEHINRNILSKNDTSGNPLSNTYHALKSDKKLTIGYLGGSITYGSSAGADITDENGTVIKGDISLSYANRTTAWFEKNFPDAVIEHINAGISDTATNFGNYRLAADLMNTNGHDMPDLVFVEFTSNDWIYNDMAGKQSLSDLERQAESLVHNIYSHNPYCDIVFVFTARGKNDSSRPAYVSVAEHYGIQYIDMGIPMQKLMTERGASQESAGKYYYTVDNLHPSSIGYGIYFDEICEVLTERLKDEPDSSPVKIDHAETSPEPMNDGLWTRPTVITASWLASSGKNIKKFTGCNNTMYGMSRDKMQSVAVTPDSYFINGTDAKINFEFTGTTFSVILYMNPNGVNMDYTIDGESKNFTIDKGAWVAFQCYNHTQLFVVEQNLPYGHHKVELTFNPTSGGKVNVRFGGIGVAGEVQK